MGPLPKLAAVACSIVFSLNVFPQDSFRQPQALLREASTLIPKIDENQRSSAAANVAGQQTRIGDLEGAVASSHLAGSPEARVFATGTIAWPSN
jgi:hypothetical protein